MAKHGANVIFTDIDEKKLAQLERESDVYTVTSRD